MLIKVCCSNIKVRYTRTDDVIYMPVHYLELYPLPALKYEYDFLMIIRYQMKFWKSAQ